MSFLIGCQEGCWANHGLPVTASSSSFGSRIYLLVHDSGVENDTLAFVIASLLPVSCCVTFPVLALLGSKVSKSILLAVAFP